MRSLLQLWLATCLGMMLVAAPASSQNPPAPDARPAPTRVREIFVPFADLNVVLDADIQRVFLTRQEYEALLAKARHAPLTPPPQAASLLSAEYEVQVEDGRALVKGTIGLEVLDRGLQALPLDLSGVGIRAATIDGRPAPLTRDPQGKPLVLVEGLGRKTLLLDLVAPLETSAAWQSLHVQLPRPAAYRMRLAVPGNVEVKSGADVLARTLDGQTTRFELLPNKGGEPLVLSLNNRQLLQQRVVMARSVIVDEVTQAYEKVHASVSLSILRGAVEQFRFELPDGFEVNEVETPLLAKWVVVEGAAAPAAKPEAKPVEKPDAAAPKTRVLEVTLREPTTEPVRLNVTATRLAPALDAWRLPRFAPLEVASHVAVVGLLVDERLKFDSLASRGLIPVDAGSIAAALPASVFAAEPSAPRVRSAAAFYAPQPDFELSARFAPPPPRLNVVSNVLLLLDERRQLVRGGFELRPEVERLFHVDFTVPAVWQVTQVKGADGNPLAYEAFPADEGKTRLRVLLNPSVAPGGSTRISFEAEATPEGWIGDWPQGQRDVAFPSCVVVGATRDEGALAVHAMDDLEIRPGDAAKFRGVTPLDANEKARFGLGDVASDLVFRYEGADYALAFVAARGKPTITARTFSFLKVEAENLAAHYELSYFIERAGVQRLSFWLPASTPETIAIRGLDGAVVKEYSSEPLTAADGAKKRAERGESTAWRRWTVQLAGRARDKVRLAVDFQQRLPNGDFADYMLPLVRADEAQVSYQSGLVSVEGSAELDVEVGEEAEGPGRPKRIDVGELAQADYVTGRRVLGAYGFVGDNPRILVNVSRRPAHPLPTAIIQRAELVTLVARSGLTQTAVRYQFRTKDMFLELQLPTGAKLWSAYLDGQPLAPQRSGDSLLLSLTAAPANQLRNVQVVFEAPIQAFSFRGNVAMAAPVLRLRTEAGEAGDEVAVADLQWQVVLPTGYRLTHSGGTVFPDLNDASTQRQLARRHSPWLDLAAAPGAIAYGVGQSLDAVMPKLHAARESRSAMLAKSAAPTMNYSYEAAEGMPTADYAMPMAPPMSGPAAGGMPGGGGMGGLGGFGMGAGGAIPPGAMGPGGMAPGMPPPAKSEGGAAAAGKDQRDKFRLADEKFQAEMPKSEAPSDNSFRSNRDRSGGTNGRPNDERSAGDVAAARRPATASTSSAKPENTVLTAPQGGEGRELAQARSKEDRVDANSSSARGVTWAARRGSESQVAAAWALEGVRSLPIEFNQYLRDGNAEVATFRSLGVAPSLEAALVHRQQLRTAALAAAIVLFLYGLTLTNASTGVKTRLVTITLVVVTVLPLAGIWVNETATVCDHVFWGAIALAAWYLLVGLCRRLSHPSDWSIVRRWKAKRQLAAATRATNASTTTTDASSSAPPTEAGGTATGVSTASVGWILTLIVGALSATTAMAQVPAEPPPRKITVPDDAIVVPYNVDDPQGVRRADRILVPLAKYQELWALANPGRAPLAAEAAKLPAQFAWSGARYEAVLASGEELTLSATLDLQIFAPGTIDVPLQLAGGVVTSAKLDGQPASLRLIDVAPAQPPKPQQQQADKANQAPAAPPAIVALAVRGPGRKQLTLTIGMKLQRRGGWRVAEGQVPVAPSTAIVLRVPDAKTEVRLGDVFDRAKFETTAANERIETALGPLGIVNLQWRPKVAEAEVDKSLTVTSKGDVELREDAVRVVWQLNLEFPRSRRETFSVYLPAEYLLERVLGDNIRGWNVVKDDDRQRLDVTLLKAAVDHESFAVVISRRGRVGEGTLAEFDLPSLEVTGAALHQGAISLARSPSLDVRLTEVRGLDRTDVPAVRTADALNAREESPLFVQPYQALKFATSGFGARLHVAALVAPPAAELRSVWKIDPREMLWETQLLLRGGQRPTYQVRLLIPENLTVDHVAAEHLHDWAITTGPEGRVLTAYLTSGAQRELMLVLRGRLPPPAKDAPVPVPVVKPLDVAAQDAHIVVQVDPSVNVTTEALKGIESVLLNRTHGWLNADQRRLARLALHVQSPDYSGVLRLVRREPRVSATSVTNVRVTGRSIEETLLIDFRIEEAGIRQVSLLLPAWMRDARITAPLLREKQISELPLSGPGQVARIRVRLDLQDEIMGSFRVLVESDRLLTAEAQEAPLPVIETGRTEQRLIAVESSGRDEVEFDEPRDIDVVTAPQQAWNRLAELFGKNILAAYQVKPDASSPRLAYHLRERPTVVTVGARIGLAETQLEVDGHGAYRGRQTYHIDNGTEQFLVVALPAQAKLWTALVAGEPVKPQQVPGGKPDEIRIPIVKTAPGDLDYQVELVYGGNLPSPGAWGKMSFPLVRTVNINVDLSRVRLLLPASHRWFQFGGTLGRVDDQGQFEAGFLEYQTKQLSRLSQLLQSKSDDDLQRVRVTNNLRQLGLALHSYQSGSGVASGLLQNDEYSRKLSTFNDVLSKTQQQVEAETVKQQAQQAEQVVTDNRTKLNAFFAQQDANRASNVVGQLGRNFDDAPQSQDAKEAAANPLNPKWFDANNLAQSKTEAKGKARIMDREAADSPDGAKGGKPAGGKKAAETNETLRDQLQELNKAQQSNKRSGNRAQEESTELNRRYQQRLEQQNLNRQGQAFIPNQAAQPQPQIPTEIPEPSVTAPRQPTVNAPSGGPQNFGGGRAVPQVDGVPSQSLVTEALGDAEQTAVATGLASLTVDLPGRGEQFMFSTQGGQLEITVHTFDVELLGRLLRLAAVGGALAVLGLVVNVVRKRAA